MVGCCCCCCCGLHFYGQHLEEHDQQQPTIGMQQQFNPVSAPRDEMDRGAPQPLPLGNAGASYRPPSMATSVVAVAGAGVDAAPTAKSPPKTLAQKATGSVRVVNMAPRLDIV